MWLRIVTAILSTLLFGMLISLNTLVNEGIEDFFEAILFFVIFSFPTYLIFGTTLSYLIDKLVLEKIKNSTIKVLSSFTLYSIAGILASSVLVLILSENLLMSSLVETLTETYIPLIAVFAANLFKLTHMFTMQWWDNKKLAE